MATAAFSPEKGEKNLCTSLVLVLNCVSADLEILVEAQLGETTVLGSDGSTEEFTYTEEEERAVRRKLDKYLVPLTTFLYLLCFLDR
jgi:hypothetical protein